MDSDEKTPQQRLDENPELLAQITESRAKGREGVPHRERHTEEIIPPELRPHR